MDQGELILGLLVGLAALSTIARLINVPYPILLVLGTARRDGDDSDGIEDRSLAYQQLSRELLEAQRRALVELRNQGRISDEVMLRIERSST